MRRNVRRPIKASENEGIIKFDVMKFTDHEYFEEDQFLEGFDPEKVGTVMLPESVYDFSDYDNYVESHELFRIIDEAGVFDMLMGKVREMRFIFTRDGAILIIDINDIDIWDDYGDFTEYEVGMLVRRK
jgi:hypothetical protein